MHRDSSEKPIGIIAALESEIAGLRREMARGDLRSEDRGRIVEGTIGGRRVLLARSGIGPDRAARTARRLLQGNGLDALLSIGYTGGTVDRLRPGDLVIAEEVLSLDGMPAEKGPAPGVTGRLSSDSRLVEKAREAAAVGSMRFHVGVMATLGEPANSPDLKRRIGEDLGVCSVEMESAAVAGAAAAASVPFVAIRTVSDRLGRRLPSRDEIKFWESKKRSPSIFLAALTRPVLFAEMLILWMGLRVASARLNRFIIDYISKLG
ncbi:hypothetical protein ACFL4G_03985 [Thermodesulfobacteriota bacterium]